MKRWRVLCLALGLFTVATAPEPASAQTFLDLAGLSPYTHYKQFETEHFTITYQEGYFDFAERAATHLEHAHDVISPILKWQPRHRTHVLIADNEDAANGFAAPALRVGMVLIATPPDAWFSTTYSEDWIKLLVWHEYTHVLNIDPTTEWMEALRILFGDVIRPNGLWPIWMLEGLAVYYETRTSTMGRGRSPYYDGVLRAFIEEHRFDNAQDYGITLDRVNGDYPAFPGGEIPYLFGYEMWQQMAKSYADRSKAESDMGELSIRSSARVPFFIEGNQENVTGKTWTDYWDEFVQDAQSRLEPELARIRKEGVTGFESRTDADFSAIGGAISPDGKWLAYTKTSTRRRTGLYLQNLQTGEETRIDDKILGVGLAFTPDSRQLIYSSIARHATYQYYSDLFSYDLESGKVTQLTDGLRAKDPTLSPDGKTVAFIKVQHGTHTFWTASLTGGPAKPQLRDFKVVYRPANFTILGTPKFLNESRLVFSEQGVGKPQSDLKLLDLNRNQADTILSNGAMNRSLAVDKNTVYFVSDPDGVENLYRLEPARDGWSRPIRLTNVTTGVTLPFVAPDGGLWASRLTSRGYQIGRFPSLTRASTAVPALDSKLAPNAPEPLASALTPDRDLKLTESQAWEYSPWSTLAPRAWAPIAYFQYSSLAGFEMGGSVLGFDSTGKHQYFGLLSYQFKTRSFEPFLSYTYYGFRPAITLSASSDVFDVGQDVPDQSFRRSEQVAIAFTYPIRYTFGSLVPSLYFAEEWNGLYDINTHERLGFFDPDYNRNQIPVIGASVRFADFEQSRFGFMPERGDAFTLAGEGREYDPDYALWKYLITYEHHFAVSEHSVLVPKARWLASSRTTSGVDRFYSLAQGKSTGNITDRGTSSSLNALGIRGYLTDTAVHNRATGVLSIDYHFPIDRIFRGSGTLPFFIRQAHGFVFFDEIFIQNVRYGDLYLPAFGGGVSFDTTLFVRAPIRFNFEMQNGTRKDFGGEQNFFFSIQSDSLF